MATKPRISAPTHHKERPEVPVMPPVVRFVAMPPPPEDMPPAARAEWLRIGPQLELDGLHELDLPIVEALCNAVADLSAARLAWVLDGAPQYISRTAGLRAHPALAIIRALGADVLRYRNALQHPPVPGQAARAEAAELDADEQAVAELRATPEGRAVSDRWFSGH